MCQIVQQMLRQLYRFFFNSSHDKIEDAGEDEMTDKIAVMEGKITQLEEQNKELQRQLDYNRNKEASLQKILCNYDNLLKKVIMERSGTPPQDQTAIHLENLEAAFCELLRKYDKAKLIVQGFQQNESLLKKQVTEYEDILENLKLKFTTYKSVSEETINSVKHTKSVGNVKGKRRRLATSY